MPSRLDFRHSGRLPSWLASPFCVRPLLIAGCQSQPGGETPQSGAPAATSAAAAASAAAAVDPVARGQYLVNAIGCDDCHTPAQARPERPRARPGTPPLRASGLAHLAAAARARRRALGRFGHGHPHRVRRTLGDLLRLEPDPARADGARGVDRGDVPAGDAHRAAHGDLASDHAAHAVALLRPPER